MVLLQRCAETVIVAMSELVVIGASVLLAIVLPDPQANKDYAMAQRHEVRVVTAPRP